jgi:glycine cleavage system H protein
MEQFKVDLKFTDSHEWIKVENGVGTVGISRYAQKELGEIVYIELPQIGSSVKKGSEVVVVESTKAATDIYSPVSGTIVAVNEALKLEPEKINNSPEEEGWLLKIKLADLSELDQLQDLKNYLKMFSKSELISN